MTRDSRFCAGHAFLFKWLHWFYRKKELRYVLFFVCYFPAVSFLTTTHVFNTGISLYFMIVLCNLYRYSNLHVKVMIVNILLLFVEPNILSIVFDYIQLFVLLSFLNQFSICFTYILYEFFLLYLVVSNLHVYNAHTFFVFVNSELQY